MTQINADRELKKLLDLAKPEATGKEKEILVSCNKLKDYAKRLQDLDEKVLPYIDDSELDSQMELSDQRSTKITDSVYRAEIMLKQRERASSTGRLSDSVSSVEQQSENTAKLLKLQMKPFAGDTLHWREFWDRFNVSVHSKAKLSSIEKFQYLKSFLRGEALHIVEGYSLSFDTYETSLATLKKRYDHSERCINAHLEAMIYMDSASSEVGNMPVVFDRYETHIRSLVAFGLAEDTFDRVFAPLMLSKFPRFIRIELNRRNGVTPWTLANARKYLKEEIAARQLGSLVVRESFKNDKRGPERKWNNTDRQPKRSGTSMGLVSSSKEPGERKPLKFSCAFCKENGHYPEDCLKIPTSSVLFSLPCKHCNVHRSYHHSLCNKKYGPTEKPNSLNVDAKSSHLNVDAKEYNPVGSLLSASNNQRGINTTNRGISVLGAALAVVKGEKCSQRVRIIMDNGSTRSFARIDLLKRLGAKKLRSEKLGLAGLESKRRHYDQFGCFELHVASKHGDEIPILVNGLKSITCPVDRYPLNSADYPILKQFDLSDQIAEFVSDVQLDVLVGLDYYYQFVDSIEVQLDSRLVLLGSEIGIRCQRIYNPYRFSLISKAINDATRYFWSIPSWITIWNDYGNLKTLRLLIRSNPPMMKSLLKSFVIQNNLMRIPNGIQ